jgi:hypothetical protein
VATWDVFSEEELARLRGFPEITRAELIRYFTLTESDETFVRRFRGPANVLGASVQLCTLPWLGFVPDDVWPVYPDEQPEYRETQFGEHGLLSFRVDDNAELLIIFNILWTG